MIVVAVIVDIFNLHRTNKKLNLVFILTSQFRTDRNFEQEVL